MEITLKIKSLEETEELAKIIAEWAYPGMVIGLAGDLGAGKTTFTKFFARALGIKDNVNSPTFTILKIYENKIPLYHIDAYRLETGSRDFDLEEYIYGDGISVIEWYPYLKDMLPKTYLTISLEVIQSNKRLAKIEGDGFNEEIVKAISDRYSN